MSERFYDEVIAPQLLRIAKQCEENGLSLVALCEWEPGENGTTATLQENASVAVLLTHASTRAQGNIDALVMACIRYAQEHGHSSAVLSSFGVPATTEGKE